MFIQRSHLSFSKLTHLLVAYSMLLMCAHTQAQGTSPTGAPNNPTQGNPRPTKQSSDSNDAVLKALGAAAVIGAGAIILNKVFGKKEEPAKPPVTATPPAPAPPPAPVVWIGAPKTSVAVQTPTPQPKPPVHKPNEQLAKLQAQVDKAQISINTLSADKAQLNNALTNSNTQLTDTQSKLTEQIAKTASAEQRASNLRAQQETFKQRAWWWAALAVAALLGLAAALARALWFVKPKLVTVSVSPGAWSLHAEQAHAEPKGCFKIHTEWQAVRALVQKYEPNSTSEQAALRTA
jgi:uncharacterized membrane-anchored protein YhcB (DUF1043 family)